MWSIIATWPFSMQSVQKGADILRAGGSALDAAEQGIWLVETDPEVDSVGRGGGLDANGELALDAAIMNGDNLTMGAVACVRGFEHPVSIARAVMEHTRHSILVGPRAEEFARGMGFEEADLDYLVTEHARQTLAEAKKKDLLFGHDTIGYVALDSHGSMGVAMSTSGFCNRLPGRVGDTPIVGSGFYAQTGVGAAAATGRGEDIMRTCMSFRAVDLIRGGMTPQEAAETVVRTAHETLARCGLEPGRFAVVCMDPQGNAAGACNRAGFAYARAREGGAPELIEVKGTVIA